MEIIDNLIYTVLNSTKTPVTAVSDFLAPVDFDYLDVNQSMGIGTGPLDTFPKDPSIPPSGNFSYDQTIRDKFLHLEDTSVIEKGIQKHWFDIGNHFNYTNNNLDTPAIFTNLQISYHLMYAYLVENTRIAQIFEKVISLALHDEVFGMPNISTGSFNAMQWLINTENLFYKDLPAASYRNISSQLRVFPEATRRNAYFRMFGMDLAFGDYKNQKIDYPYLKASANNSGFVVLFEQFLTEVWQAYTNAKNTSGANTTDFEHIKELGIQLHDMLMSRRTSDPNLTNYKYFTLSKEEYASVIMMTWLMYALTDNNSPIIQFLKCEANSPDERLSKIGLKVGLPAHSKSKSLMEMAAPLAALLRSIENRVYENSVNIQGIITSQSGLNWSGNPAATTGRNQAVDSRNLDDLLAIMNNWEAATGHKIKNPGANITGTVRVAPQQRTNGNLLVPNLS